MINAQPDQPDDRNALTPLTSPFPLVPMSNRTHEMLRLPLAPARIRVIQPQHDNNTALDAHTPARNTQRNAR